METLDNVLLFVFISSVHAYELNLFLLFVAELEYLREVQMYQHYLMSSSSTFVLHELVTCLI